MYKILYTLIAITALTVTVSCGSDTYYIIEKEKTDSPDTTSTSQGTDKPLDEMGTASRPTDWVCISDIDPTLYMTLTIDATGIPVAMADDDLLAAFVGDACRGVTSPYRDVDGVTRLCMVILGCDGGNDGASTTAEQVELRYYSSQKHRIYLSPKFDFVPGTMLGSISEGYTPSWQ